MIQKINLEQDVDPSQAGAAVYIVMRCVGEEVKEAYFCDTEQEVDEAQERMSGFAGVVEILLKGN